MGSFELSGAFTSCPDPDYQPYGTPEFGAFLDGKPVRQGWESGMLKYPPMTTAGMNELYTRYLVYATADSRVEGKIPKLSGYGWRSVSAWWHEPLPTGWDGPIAHGVTQIVSKITNN